jgi:hypothetical protein
MSITLKARPPLNGKDEFKTFALTFDGLAEARMFLKMGYDKFAVDGDLPHPSGNDEHQCLVDFIDSRPFVE